MQVIVWDGKPISSPGIYRGVSMDAYHGRLTVKPSASRSGLWKIFDKSPAHYFKSSYLNPDRIDEEESEPLSFGRAAHHLLLGESAFYEQFAVRPDKWDSWRTNDAKTWRAEQVLDGKTVIEPKHIEAIRGMAASLAAQPLVRAGILNGLIEHSMVWQDEETGIWLKIRPDGIPTDAADFADLKTIADISDDGIERAIGDTGLNMQGAMVAMGCRAVMKREMESFSLVFSEKTAPFCARVKTLKPDDLALGEEQVRASLRMFARCLDTGRWPGPGGEQTDAEYVEMKPWKRTQILHRLALIEQELAA